MSLISQPNFRDPVDPKILAKYIDHTLLRPEATSAEIEQVCDEAVEHGFHTVCVESKWLPVVVPRLKGSGVLPITVISFPSGDLATPLKAEAAGQAVEAGAREIDMVLNRTLLKEKHYALVLKDIADVVSSVPGIPVKVILETSELTEHEKVIASVLAKTAGARFVKTSTGFSKAGATESDVRLMREVVGNDTGVKASGGVRSYADAVKMILAGATRLGTSASIAIVKGAAGGGAY